MATTTKNTDKTNESDKFDSDSLIFDTKSNQYVPERITPELQRQMQATTARRTAVAGGVGLGLEALQFALGGQVMRDPAVLAAQQEKAAAKARIAKGPDYLTRQQKADYVDVATNQAKQQAAANRRAVQSAAAATGKFDVDTLLAGAEDSVRQVGLAALDAKAAAEAQDVAMAEIKARQDEKDRGIIGSVEQMMFNLRNKRRQEQSDLLVGAGKLGGAILAEAPVASIDDEVQRLRDANVPPEEISKFIKVYRRKPRQANLAAEELVERFSGGTPTDSEKAQEDQPAPKPVEVMKWTDDATSGPFMGVEYTLQPKDGTITYQSPYRKGRTITVDPNNPQQRAAYDDIMSQRPEPRVPESETTLTKEELASRVQDAFAEQERTTMKPGNTVTDTARRGDFVGVVYTMLDNGDIQFKLGEETKTVNKERNPKAYKAITDLYRSSRSE